MDQLRMSFASQSVILSGVVFPVILAAISLMAANEPGAATHAVLSLEDGTRLLGELEVNDLALESSAVGRITVPIARIKSISFGSTNNPVVVFLTNGDQLHGVPMIDQVSVATVFGKVTVSLGLIRQLEIQPGISSGPFDAGAEFSREFNPNGLWSYGWSKTLGVNL